MLLHNIQSLLKSRYCQRLVENPDDHDYRVLECLLPEGEIGYDIAHRTGVIGQVFRLEQPIFVPDTAHHPLYDPFDKNISWELCFPLFADRQMASVINIEGNGRLELNHEMWRALDAAVRENTQFRLPSVMPVAAAPCLTDSRQIVILDQQSNVTDMARAIAAGGSSTLLVGDFPKLLGSRSPDMAEAAAQHLSASYCFFGVAPRLDLLATGCLTRAQILANDMNWWELANGRYAFVIVNP
jgi:hypothetical protein